MNICMQLCLQLCSSTSVTWLNSKRTYYLCYVCEKEKIINLENIYRKLHIRPQRSCSPYICKAYVATAWSALLEHSHCRTSRTMTPITPMNRRTPVQTAATCKLVRSLFFVSLVVLIVLHVAVKEQLFKTTV